MFDELADKLADMMRSGNTGVLVALSKACLKLQARQAHFITVSSLLLLNILFDLLTVPLCLRYLTTAVRALQLLFSVYQ